MWKKNRSKEPVIGSPTLVTTTFDNAALQSMTSINAPANHNRTDNQHQHQHHHRKDSDRHGGPGLPPLPFKSLEPNSLRSNPPSRPPVASSIYSQRDSYAAVADMSTRHGAHPLRNSHAYQSGFRDSDYTDVSPPDSPVFAPSGHPRESPDVSPIDSAPPQFTPPREGRLTSALPVPRRDTPPKENAATRAVSQPRGPSPPPTKFKPTSPRNASGRLTRWDDFSGEPTDSEKGRPAQARPGSLVAESPSTKQSSKQGFSLLTKGKELNQARKKLMEGRRGADKETKDDPARQPPPREPWKGASGRTAIVTPIEPKKGPRPPPLNTQLQPRPRKDSRSGIERKSLPSDNAAGGVSTLTVSKQRGQDNAHVPDNPTIKPVVPLKAGDNTPTTARPFPTPGSRSASETPSQSETPRAVHMVQDENVDPELSARLQNITLEPQLSSRFSATTYATTEAASSPPGTPRPRSVDKDAPPIPSMPTDMEEPFSRTFIKATTRKPTPSEVSMSTTKTLPRSPPEMEAGNRIDALEAKLNDLARRKGNINTIIHELTQVVQPSSIAYDLATRSEVKKTVASLDNELADIRKEEHEVGMKLMRARKKQDEQSNYEPSSIWVKRVTEDV
ncbi:hypothetical protein AJ79_00922 [Helicocarpus griseus UAMH5409]|uniref:Uncharacterized protein n=1 Tax=Helicocarpus griseus UAMH5409 TaxID=1447875 RepID=A0A2B7Y9P4_9EURO|nr:hypothetical protein AJ79_00922 [Helicocarpus griseus UAMH5409]